MRKSPGMELFFFELPLNRAVLESCSLCAWAESILNFDIQTRVMYVYDTITAAVEGLRKRGYAEDFNLEENCLICNQSKYHAEDFEIVEVYRFEGETDPADEAVVYAIEGRRGEKGILVGGYGPSSENMSGEIAKKLSIHRV